MCSLTETTNVCLKLKKKDTKESNERNALNNVEDRTSNLLKLGEAPFFFADVYIRGNLK